MLPHFWDELPIVWYIHWNLIMFIAYPFTSEKNGLLQRQQSLMECFNRVNLVKKLIDFALRLCRIIYVFYYKQ